VPDLGQAPLAAKPVRQPSVPDLGQAPVAARPVRQPSVPDLGQAPTPPWRIVPEAGAPVEPPPLPAATPVAPPAITPVAPPVVAMPAMPATPVAPPAATATAAMPQVVTPPQLPVTATHVGPPPLAQEPLRAHREAAPYEDPRPLIRAAIDAAMIPVHQALRDLVRRVEELEKRPAAAAAPAIHAAAPAARDAYRQSMPSYPPPVAAHGALVPQGRTLDIATINRDVHVDVDGAIDGKRRRRRLAVTVALVLLVVFGGLFGALAYSYTPHASSSRVNTSARDALAGMPLVAPAGARLT
jgi:hypothetical protein